MWQKKVLNFSGFEPGSFRSKVAHLPLEASNEDRKKNPESNQVMVGDSKIQKL